MINTKIVDHVVASRPVCLTSYLVTEKVYDVHYNFPDDYNTPHTVTLMEYRTQFILMSIDSFSVHQNNHPKT